MPEDSELEQFKEQHGGHWSETGDPDYPIEDWKTEVANGDTRMGYWEWAYQQEITR